MIKKSLFSIVILVMLPLSIMFVKGTSLDGSTLELDGTAESGISLHGSTLEFGTGTSADPCAYAGSGDYTIDCALCDTIIANEDIGGNEVIMGGLGNVSLQANVTNWAAWNVDNPCIFNIDNPYEWSS